MIHATVPNTSGQAIEFPARFARRPIPTVRRRYESEAAGILLRANALDDIDKLFSLADQSFYGHKGRAVSRVELYQPGGETVSAFVKLNWGRRRFVPRMTDLKTGQALQNLPEREWRGIGELRSLGFLVPERLAIFQRGWIWFQEAVVIQSVRPPICLDEMIGVGEWKTLSEENQNAILEGVVDVMQRIHAAGLGWRGTCTRHFFPEQNETGQWQFWLIDCEGIHRKVTSRNIARDYRKLHRAFEISEADASTLNRFERLAERAQRTHSRLGGSRLENSPALALNPALKPSV